MKKLLVIITTICVLFLPSFSLAESAYIGHVIPGGVEVVQAPYGGRLSSIMVQQGSLIQEATLVAELETNKIYAPVDGRITAVFAKSGDNAETVKAQYGAIVWIEPVHRYIVKCSTGNQQKSVDNQWIFIGEKVYLRNTSNKQREGTGIVTALSSREGDEGVFYVEVDSGEFILGETVTINRDVDYSQSSSIGSGKVQRNAPLAMNAEGIVAEIHAQEGEYVNAGSLLVETVKGDAPKINLGAIRNASTGIVAEVKKEIGEVIEQGETIVTIYPLEKLQLQIQLSEACLSDINVGDSAYVSFHWMSGSDKRYPAMVSAISYLNGSTAEGGGVNYAVILDFNADETVRIGMTATVYFGLEAQMNSTSEALPDLPMGSQ